MDALPPPARVMTARLLGPAEISVDGRNIAHRNWPGRKARSLLLVILSAPGFRLHREQVIDPCGPISTSMPVPMGCTRRCMPCAASSNRISPLARPHHGLTYVAT